MSSFSIRCSREIFAQQEIELLEQYGRELERLANGNRRPRTAAQRRFVEVSKGQCEPETTYERTWVKYLQRLDWESDPANRAAMGPRRRVTDDREDWKRMRGATWGEMQRRARGLDD